MGSEADLTVMTKGQLDQIAKRADEVGAIRYGGLLPTWHAFVPRRSKRRVEAVALKLCH